MTKARILIVDDERSMQEFLEIFFRAEGYDVTAVGDVTSALLAVESDEFDVVITDIQMPDRSGLDLLRQLRESSPESVVIVITAYASTDTAIAAMKEGAYDYVTKPFKVDEMRIVVEKALEKKLLATENQRLRRELRSAERQRSLVGNSAAAQRVYELMRQVSNTRTNVLISGESGTGKELVARAIHAASERRDKPFVAVNCGAIPDNLLESELFGHVKGAFTGAIQNKSGLFDVADGGTLFLDEIGDMSLRTQAKVLRALQEQAFEPVGGSTLRVDVRVITATNKDLEKEIAEGRFREDLYFRLNVVPLRVPALRERAEDIPLLASHFIERFSRQYGRVKRLSADAIETLKTYRWPGNVRELRNVMERLVILVAGDTVTRTELPASLRGGRGLAPEPPDGGARSLKEGREQFERRFILHKLQEAGGNVLRAAELLGLERSNLYRKMRAYGIRSGEDGG